MRPPKATDPQVAKLAREIVNIKRQIEARNFTPQLASSSIEDGAIEVNDLDGTLTGIIGKQHDGTTAAVVVSGPPPPVPAGFSAEGGQLSAVATWDGSFVDGAPAPMDYAAVEVHRTDSAVALPDPYIGSTSRVGTITTAAGASLTFAAPQGDSWLWLISRAQSGKFSEPAGPLKVTVSGAVDPDMIDQLNDDLAAASGRLDAATAAIGDDAGNITAASVAAKTGAFLKLDVNQLTVTGTSNLDTAVANKIFANVFAANKISANELNAESVGAAIGNFVNIQAQQITGGLITAEISMWSAGRIIAGQWTGACAVMSAMEGFTTKQVAADGTQYTATTLGNPNGTNQLSITDAPDSPPTFAVNSGGVISAIDMDLDRDPTFMGSALLGKFADPLAGDSWFDRLPWGAVSRGDLRSALIARGNVSCVGTANLASTGVGYLTFTAIPGRRYRFTMPYRYNISSPAASARAGVKVTYNFSVNEPGDPSPTGTLIAEKMAPISTTASLSGITEELVFTWTPSQTVPVNVKFLVSLTAQNCTMTTEPTTSPVSWIATVEDIGAELEDSAAIYTSNGTTTAKKRYVSIWEASNSAGYTGAGASTTFYTGKQSLGHGYYSSALGNNRSSVLFNNYAIVGETTKTMATCLTGASLVKAELFVRSLHWAYPDGGTAVFRPLNGTTIGATLTDAYVAGLTPGQSQSFTSRAQGFWTTVPTSWFSPTKTGIVIGPSTNTSQQNYAYFAAHNHPDPKFRPKVRLTYVR